jgi:hypothetical protein
VFPSLLHRSAPLSYYQFPSLGAEEGERGGSGAIPQSQKEARGLLRAFLSYQDLKLKIGWRGQRDGLKRQRGPREGSKKSKRKGIRAKEREEESMEGANYSQLTGTVMLTLKGQTSPEPHFLLLRS